MSLKDYAPCAAVNTLKVSFHMIAKCLECQWIQKNPWNEVTVCNSCGGNAFRSHVFYSYEDYRDFRLKLYDWRLDRSDEEVAKGVEIQRNELALDLL